MPEFIRLPAAFVSSTSAIVEEVLVAEGTAVAAGDAIFSVETDKAVIDVTATTSGYLAKLLAAPGASIAVGEPLAIVLHEGESLDELALGDPGSSTSESANAPAVYATGFPDVSPAHASTAPVKPETPSQRIFTSPLARKLAREAGLELESIPGTGVEGRIVRDDVHVAIAKRDRAISLRDVVQAASDAPRVASVEPLVDLVPHTRMRRTIASRLTQSKQKVPHFYLQRDVNMTEALAFRKWVNGDGQRRITVNDLILKAASIALRDNPESNVQWIEDGMRTLDTCDVSVAVAVPGGLYTPVIRGLDGLSTTEIARRVAVQVQRCHEGAVSPQDLAGGSMTVSNLGMYGVDNFAAILNPPQSMILAVGTVKDRVIAVDGRPSVAPIATVTLSCDHRAIDGAVGAKWLSRFSEALESPAQHLA